MRIFQIDLQLASFFLASFFDSINMKLSVNVFFSEEKSINFVDAFLRLLLLLLRLNNNWLEEFTVSKPYIVFLYWCWTVEFWLFFGIEREEIIELKCFKHRSHTETHQLSHWIIEIHVSNWMHDFWIYDPCFCFLSIYFSLFLTCHMFEYRLCMMPM